MTELKTLKNMEISSMDICCSKGIQDFYKQLKAEAVKWVKEKDWTNFICFVANKEKLSLDNPKLEKINPDKMVCYFIEYFFNLTESDLEEKE